MSDPRPTAAPSLAIAEIARLVGAAPPEDAGAVHGITLDSRRVVPGDLYAALPGLQRHGAEFASNAVAAGAAAILTDPAGAERSAGLGVPVLVVAEPRALLGDVAATIYGAPAEHLTMIAVTGTQGKTTTTRLLEGALTVTGERTGVIGTVGTRINGEAVPTALTTPEAPDLHALLAVMREQGVHACAMEVSSHALVMGRVDGVVFDVAGFTNLGRDHLDFHTDLDDYFAAKARLFTPTHSRRGLINIDDEYGRRLLVEPQIPLTTCSINVDTADWRAVDIAEDAAGSAFRALGPDGVDVTARVPLPGRFNVANALMAIALAGEAGLDVVGVAAAMAHGAVPGRLERISDDGAPITAYVDYAHKPDAVHAVLRALRPATTGRLIVVIGAGGDRDQGKRPLMGAAAAEHADVVVVTDDNPRSEDAAVIRAAVLAGAREGSAEVLEIGDRGVAIDFAVASARDGDTVVVAGKGHETGQEIAGVVHPFDDRVALRVALERFAH